MRGPRKPRNVPHGASDSYLRGYNMSFKELGELIDEASLIAHRVNVARFSGQVPSAEDTVRLCEIMDIMTEATQ